MELAIVWLVGVLLSLGGFIYALLRRPLIERLVAFIFQLVGFALLYFFYHKMTHYAGLPNPGIPTPIISLYISVTQFLLLVIPALFFISLIWTLLEIAGVSD